MGVCLDPLISLILKFLGYYTLISTQEILSVK